MGEYIERDGGFPIYRDRFGYVAYNQRGYEVARDNFYDRIKAALIKRRARVWRR